MRSKSRKRIQDECDHSRARWGEWQDSLTKGVQHRWKECPCGKIVDSQQRDVI